MNSLRGASQLFGVACTATAPDHLTLRPALYVLLDGAVTGQVTKHSANNSTGCQLVGRSSVAARQGARPSRPYPRGTVSRANAPRSARHTRKCRRVGTSNERSPLRSHQRSRVRRAAGRLSFRGAPTCALSGFEDGAAPRLDTTGSGPDTRRPSWRWSTNTGKRFLHDATAKRTLTVGWATWPRATFQVGPPLPLARAQLGSGGLK
jgi:hypothetical protein